MEVQEGGHGRTQAATGAEAVCAVSSRALHGLWKSPEAQPGQQPLRRWQ